MLLGDGDPPDCCKCKKVSRIKTAEQKKTQKLVGTVQKGHSGIKIGRDPRTLGDRDPKSKCKKVSGTKIAEQKNSRTKTVE